MCENRPEWIVKYTVVGFPRDWADEALKMHNTDLSRQLSNDIAPENFFDFNPISIEENSSHISKIDIPTGYTISEVLLFLIDILDCFGKHIPKSDADIYDLYLSMNEAERINIEISFDDFYVFTQKLQYLEVKNTNSYNLLSNVVEKYTYETIPVPESTWEIPYKGGRIEIYIHGSDEEAPSNLTDSPIRGKIVDIIEPVNSLDIHNGDDIRVLPGAFKKGNQIN